MKTRTLLLAAALAVSGGAAHATSSTIYMAFACAHFPANPEMDNCSPIPPRMAFASAEACQGVIDRLNNLPREITRDDGTVLSADNKNATRTFLCMEKTVATWVPAQ